MTFVSQTAAEKAANVVDDDADIYTEIRIGRWTSLRSSRDTTVDALMSESLVMSYQIWTFNRGPKVRLLMSYLQATATPNRVLQPEENRWASVSSELGDGYDRRSPQKAHLGEM